MQLSDIYVAYLQKRRRSDIYVANVELDFVELEF